MRLKRLLVANLVISSIALTTGGAALGIAYFDTDKVDTVIYKCDCPTEVQTESEVDVDEEEVIEEDEPYNLGEFKLTAYCPCSKCCGKWANGITSTGTTAVAGRTIAVDPAVIPYGTKVLINGVTYIAEDCGGAIKGNRIDVYFDSHREALKFGVQYADVYIIGG